MEDLTDIEREEQLRNFWRDNWLTIVGGVAIGLGGIAGWRYWQDHVRERAEKAEADYAGVIDALAAHSGDDAATRAKALREDHPASPYADQAELALARAAVDRRDYDEAGRLLRVVMDGSRDPELRHVARLRLARVLIEQQKAGEAVTLLDPSGAGAFAANYHEVRGDALGATGDTAGARREYDAALSAAAEAGSVDRDYLALKRDALPPAPEAAPAAEAAPDAGEAP